MSKKRLATGEPSPAAGNGLLDRRQLFAAAAAASTAALNSRPAAAQGSLPSSRGCRSPGRPFVGYGQPSKFEAKVVRVFASAPGTTGTGASRTPHHLLNGTITPNGLHFERHHSGIPDIDPDAHRLLIHGLVKRPLMFTLDALARYPMVSRIAFIECGGNSGRSIAKEPVAAAACRRCTASSPAPNGPACRSPSCSTKPASIRRRTGCSPKARTPRHEPQRADGQGHG